MNAATSGVILVGMSWLYEAWEKPDEAAQWRKELEAFTK
jgi:hypothetical protein